MQRGAGVLHTFTSDSDLSRDGHARRLIYAWGSAPSVELQEASVRLARTDVAIHLDKLVKCFRRALERYLGRVVQNPERVRRIAIQDSQWFTHLDQQLLKEFLRLTSPGSMF